MTPQKKKKNPSFIYTRNKNKGREAAVFKRNLRHVIFTLR